MQGKPRPASIELIARFWEERWGLPIVSVRREYLPPDVEGRIWRGARGEPEGLVTWAIEGERAEIVSLNAFGLGRRIGSRLMDAAEAELALRGVRRVTVVTSNDNLRALAFYLRRGYRLVRLHL